MPKQVTIARKIELRFNTTDKETKNQCYETLRAWRNVACNGANMAISAMYMTLKGESVSYLEKKLAAMRERVHDYEDLDKKAQKQLSKDEDDEIYKLIKAEKKDHFVSSELTHYYQMLATYYKDSGIPSAIIGCISNQVGKDFAADKSDYLRLNQSLRTYKKKMPIPFTAQSVRNIRRSTNETTDKEYKDFCFMLFGLPFRTHFGRDRSNNYYLLNEAFSMHFLPHEIIDAQRSMSDQLLALRAAGSGKQINVFNVNGSILCSAEYENMENETKSKSDTGTEKNEDHRYIITATLSRLDQKQQPVVTEHRFYMKPCKIDKKDSYKIVSNYKLGDSKIQLMERQQENSRGQKSETTKIFLYASLTFDKEPWKLDENKICYCELDPETPIIAKIGSKEYKIGNKEEFMYRRLGIQGAYQRIQKNIKFTNGGRGIKKKYKPLEAYRAYEKDTISDKVHKYSREIIKLCLQNNCKYIYLCIPKKPQGQETDEEKFLLRNWSYGQIQDKLEYKAKGVNIEVCEYSVSE